MAFDDKQSTPIQRLAGLHRLRHRLTMLFGLVLLIPSAIGIIAAIDTYRDQVSRARESTQHFVVLIANYESRFLSQTEQLLRGLANDPGLSSVQQDATARANCARLLADTIKPYSAYASGFLSDLTGNMVCSSNQSEVGANVGTHGWFKNVVSSRNPTIGSVPPVSSAQPVIAYAYPLFDRDGQIAGVLGLNIRMAWFDEAQRELKLPPASSVFLMDKAGSILAGPEAAAQPSKDGAPELSFIAEAADGLADTFDGIGMDKVSRVYSAAQIDPSKLIVLFGVPTEHMIAPLRRILWTEVGILVLAWLLAIISASVGTRYLVTRWTDRLTRTASQLTAGELSARPNMVGAPAELQQLGAAMNALAQRIGEREADLKTSLSQKHAMLKEIHHRIKNYMQTVVSFLSLHARSAESPDVKLAFSDAQARIQAFALVHRHLYESEDLQAVRADLFIANLSRLLQDATGVSQRQIRLDINVPPVRMAGEQAAILASFITEVMTNAFKHAFPNERHGTIKIEMSATDDGDAVLTIADDGIGFSLESTDATFGSAALGTGLTLIAGFAKQIGGVLERSDGEPGTRTTLRFKLHGLSADDAALWRPHNGLVPQPAAE